MTDLRLTIQPKSDQLNADDLIGRSLTIKVSGVKLSGDADQPVCVHYEGDNGKPYKPCLSMRRVMIKVWGDQGAAFVGKRMTLYRDDKVTFGKDAVGGIRISHMSDIDREVTMALTATRANRKPYTVKPMAPERGEPVESVDLLTVLTKGRAAAARGSAALTAWWSSLDRDEKAAAKPVLDSELKAAAATADQAALDTTDDDFPGGRPPSAREDTTAGSAEANADEGSGLAVDVIAWADKLISDLPFFTPEQVEFLESDRKELAKFAILKATDIDKARELERAIEAVK